MSEPASDYAIPLAYRRRATRVVRVGDVAVGGGEPIRIQSMLTANTQDVDSVISEMRGLVEAGCEIVRLTVPTRKDLAALPEIRRRMALEGLTAPLVADIHFNPRLALGSVPHVEKVRINPGNYVDQKRFEVREYTPAQYAEELERVEETLLPLIAALREHGRSLRIGVNHGSLSDRVMNRYGDTPRGMVECAMEYLRILAAHGYHETIVSMKSSNPLVVIQAYRLLVRAMEAEGMDYPLHLGVTEAGSGAEGRVKSAIGIGTLLCDGLGDTVRVSLTEPSTNEIPAARELVAALDGLRGGPAWPEERFVASLAPENLGRRRATRRLLLGDAWPGGVGRNSQPPCAVGGGAPVALMGLFSRLMGQSSRLPGISGHPDGKFPAAPEPFDALLSPPLPGGGTESGSGGESGGEGWRLLPPERAAPGPAPSLILLGSGALDGEPLRRLLREGRAFTSGALLLLEGEGAEEMRENRPQSPHFLHPLRRLAGMLEEAGLDWPLGVVLPAGNGEATGLGITSEIGALAADGLLDALVCPTDDGASPLAAYGRTLLQAARLRSYAPEYISCPSCGRTLFDLEETTGRIKARTSHLKGVKIGIMGCIVNGPGEMADADFGYVGGAPGKINLYKGQHCVERGVPAAQAVERLVALLKQHGAWVEPG